MREAGQNGTEADSSECIESACRESQCMPKSIAIPNRQASFRELSELARIWAT